MSALTIALAYSYADRDELPDAVSWTFDAARDAADSIGALVIELALFFADDLAPPREESGSREESEALIEEGGVAALLPHDELDDWDVSLSDQSSGQ